MATNPGTVLQVVCNFNMLYIGCQYQVIKKVKKKRKADLPYLSFLQDEIGNTHIFFWPYPFMSSNISETEQVTKNLTTGTIITSKVLVDKPK